LGRQGTRREAALQLRKPRLSQGPWQKARRGARRVALPLGSVYHPAGAVVYDPAAQVQHGVRLLVRKCVELGTLHARWRDLRQHQSTVGVRLREGPAKGPLAWRRPNRMTLQNLLKPPLYTGA
jgi:hypothetical protein